MDRAVDWTLDSNSTAIGSYNKVIIVKVTPRASPRCSLTIGADWYRPDREGFSWHAQAHVVLVKTCNTINANDNPVLARIGFDRPLRMAA